MSLGNIIDVQNLSAGYGNNIILQNITFTVARGEKLAIAGGSGCGKSTLLRHLIGLNPILGGKAFINDVDIGESPERAMERVHREIGVLFQSGALFSSLSLAENIMLPLMDFGGLKEEAAQQVAKMKLSLVSLSGYENHLPDEVSGGMQKRAGLARALALDPEVLFLDEPSAGLDPITSADLDQLILRLNAGLGITIVMVTHELASIFAVADRVLFLDKSVKGMLAIDSPQVLRHSDNPLIRNFFERQGNVSPAQPQANN